MKCYVHHNADAIGTCRACNKGLCPLCVCDLGHSICCKGHCEEKASTLNTQLLQSSILINSQKRNRFLAPTFFISIGLIFFAFSIENGISLNMGVIMGIGFTIFGMALGLVGHNYAKAIARKT